MFPLSADIIWLNESYGGPASLQRTLTKNIPASMKALPAVSKLPLRVVVRPAGFEPATYGFEVRKLGVSLYFIFSYFFVNPLTSPINKANIGLIESDGFGFLFIYPAYYVPTSILMWHYKTLRWPKSS